MRAEKRFKICILIILILSTMIVAISFNNNKLIGVFEKSYRNKYQRNISEDKLNELLSKLNIKEYEYNWSGKIEYGNRPKVIVLHHAASEATVEEVHEMHKKKEWYGIGYHFYIGTDGTIYRGRSEDVIGAHVKGHNKDTLGICLQGNFEKKKLEKEQLDSLVNLLTYLSFKYPIGEFKGHNDLAQTLCPGKNNSVKEIEKRLEEKMKEITKNQ